MEDIKAVAEELVAMTSDAVSKMNKELKEQYQVYKYGVPPVYFEPHQGIRRRRMWNTKEDDKCFAKKVAKRRKKNKNKKTHRK